MKKFLLSVAIGCLSVFGAETTVDLAASTNTVLLTGAANIYSVTVISTNAANATLSLYDNATAGAAGLTWVSGAYTNISKAPSYITNVYTLPTGESVTNIYRAMKTTWTAVPGATNNKTPIKTVTAIADATTEALVAKQTYVGLSAYSASPLTVTVVYEQRP